MKNFEVPKGCPTGLSLTLLGTVFRVISELISCCFKAANRSDFSAL
jgi:hypothetical protein